MRSRWWPIWGCLVVAGGLLGRRTFAVVTVDGSSMLPTYAHGDRLLAVRPPLSRRVRVGDVVVVTAPAPTSAAGGEPPVVSETLVKRVRYVEVFADGPGRRVFVEGDNRPSYDSHTFGWLASTAVVGRVVRVISAS